MSTPTAIATVFATTGYGSRYGEKFGDLIYKKYEEIKTQGMKKWK